MDYLARVHAALSLIAETPGYQNVAADLQTRLLRGRIRYLPALSDRGQATLTGQILLGPEAVGGSVVGLAETLVHEHFHLKQFPLLKTTSFWAGVATGTPVMRRYERPAYQYAYRFLQAVETAFSHHAADARQEMGAVTQVYQSCYGEPL